MTLFRDKPVETYWRAQVEKRGLTTFAEVVDYFQKEEGVKSRGRAIMLAIHASPESYNHAMRRAQQTGKREFKPARSQTQTMRRTPAGFTFRGI